jgi:hypothetical protein
MANQKKSQQAKKIEAMGKKAGATKAQVAQGLARAGGKSSYNVTNKDVKRAGQAAKIIAGAAVTAVGPGKVVKGVQAASKIAKVGSSVRALKAAQGKSLASPIKKVAAKKNAKERLVAKNMASANIKVFGVNPKEAYAKSAKAAEDMKARDIKFAKKLPNTYDKKTMKNVKSK